MNFVVFLLLSFLCVYNIVIYLCVYSALQYAYLSVRCKRKVHFLCCYRCISRNIDDFCYGVFKRWLHFKWVAIVDLIKKLKTKLRYYCMFAKYTFNGMKRPTQLMWSKKKKELHLQSCMDVFCAPLRQIDDLNRSRIFFFRLSREYFLFANYCLRLAIKVSINWKKKFNTIYKRKRDSNRIRSNSKHHCISFKLLSAIVFCDSPNFSQSFAHIFNANRCHPESVWIKINWKLKIIKETRLYRETADTHRFYHSAIISLIGEILCKFSKTWNCFNFGVHLSWNY